MGRTKIELIAEYLRENRQAGHTHAMMKGAENFTQRTSTDRLTILVSREVLAHHLREKYKLPVGVKLRSIHEHIHEDMGAACDGALVLDNSAIEVLAREVEEMRKKLWWESRHPFRAWWKRARERIQKLDVDHLSKQSSTY